VIYVLYFVHVLVCVFLILVVLLQQGKGADLSVFGGGSTQAAFGARGATTLLHKLTVASFVIFIVTTLTIAIFQGGGGASVMSDVKEQRQQTAPSPVPSPKAVPSPGPAEAAPAPAAPAAPPPQGAPSPTPQPPR
jgi:preprotein translocase subunit SecG